MGQYYVPIIIAEDGTVSTFSSHEYNSGLKLMEHSWIGNDFVNAVITQLWNHPMRVAWIGDYSKDPYEDAYAEKICKTKFQRYYRMAWGKNRKKYIIRPDTMNMIGIHSRAYLINHSQQIYVDLGEYIDANLYHESWTNRYTGKTEYYDSCVHPLPLLTACGNDRGGGDYRSCYADYDKVGTWAFDLIEVSPNCPEGYAKIMYGFSERKED